MVPRGDNRIRNKQFHVGVCKCLSGENESAIVLDGFTWYYLNMCCYRGTTPTPLEFLNLQFLKIFRQSFFKKNGVKNKTCYFSVWLLTLSLNKHDLENL